MFKAYLLLHSSYFKIQLGEFFDMESVRGGQRLQVKRKSNYSLKLQRLSDYLLVVVGTIIYLNNSNFGENWLFGKGSIFYIG
jgi:hypothetical protein